MTGTAAPTESLGKASEDEAIHSPQPVGPRRAAAGIRGAANGHPREKNRQWRAVPRAASSHVTDRGSYISEKAKRAAIG